MATLSQTLNPLKRSAEGGLEKAPDLKQAMANVGATQAPTMPIGGTLIGANPDAVKMVGTSAQLNAAQSKQQDQAAPVDSLQTAVRQKQSRTATTTEEQGKMQKSADMQALGGLGDRVTNFIDTQRAKLTTAAPVVAQANAPVSTTTSTIADPAAASAALNALMANPNDTKLQKAANLALGRNLDTIIRKEEIAGLYQTAQEAVSSGGAKTIDDSLNISTLISDPEFGYDSNSLSNLLGLPADQINSMTVTQLRDAVDATISKEFSASATNQQMATSGIAGQAERAMAQSAGRELSSTGIRATESDTSNLEAQIANADQVSFGGNTYKIEDLLNDETVSGIISDYMNSAVGSPERSRIDKTEPALSAFIKKNDAILHDASLQLTHGADVFQKIQEQVKELGTQGGAQVDKKLMTKLITGFGQDFQTANVDPESIPFLANLTGKTDYQKATVVNAVNTAVEKDIASPDELAVLSKAELEGLNIGVAGSNWNNYVTNTENRKAFSAKSEDDKVASMVSGSWTVPEIKEVVQVGKTRSVLGMGDPINLGTLDPNNLDGSYATFNPPSTLAAASKGASVPTKLTITPPPPLNAMYSTLYSKLSGAASDGEVSGAEISAAGLGLEELIALEDNVGRGGSNISKDVTGIRRAATIAPTTTDVDAILSAPNANAIEGGAAFNQTTTNLVNMVKGMDPKRRDMGTVRTRASTWISSLVGGLSKLTSNAFINTRGVLLQSLDALNAAGLLDATGQKALAAARGAKPAGTVAAKSSTNSGGRGTSAGGRGEGGHAGSSGGNSGGIA